jgi:hypothetical protein
MGRRGVDFRWLVVLVALASPAARGAPPDASPAAGEPGRGVAMYGFFIDDRLVIDRVDRNHVYALAAQQLKGGGIRLVPPPKTWPVMDERLRAHQGEPPEVRLKAARRETLAILKERLGADWLIVLELAVKDAPVADDQATWDGVTERASTRTLRARGERARLEQIPAFSLVASLADPDGETLVTSAGGIRLVWHEGVKGELVPVPDADLLADEAQLTRAVERAMAPVVAALAAPGSP